MTLRTATATRFHNWPKYQTTPQTSRQAVPISLVIDAAAYTYDVTHEQLLGKTRQQPYMWIRQAAHWLAYTLTDNGYETVGRAFQRDHTTIIHSVRRTNERRQAKPEFAAELDALAKRIRQAAGIPCADQPEPEHTAKRPHDATPTTPPVALVAAPEAA